MVTRGRTTSNREYALSVGHARQFLAVWRRLHESGWDLGDMGDWWAYEDIALMMAEYGGGRQ